MSDTGYQGTQRPGDDLGDFNAQLFAMNAVVARLNVATLVRIVAVTNNGSVSPVGFVDVQPMVNQLDGAGRPFPHVTVYGIPYFRLQGGANAVIMDPKVGDIGLCVFSDRDVSSVKSTKKQANPGSARRFSMADGVYIGGMLNGAPTQYVRFTDSGITLHTPGTVTIEAATIASSGAWSHTGTLVNNGKNVGSTHAHSGVQTGGGNTGAPL